MAHKIIFAKFEAFERNRDYYGRTDWHSSNVLEFRADQMSTRNLRSPINISMRYTRIEKTNIPSLRRA